MPLILVIVVVIVKIEIKNKYTPSQVTVDYSPEVNKL